MPSKYIATINGEGMSVAVMLHEGEVVEFTADADIDADGANGQNGAPAAYMVGNKGSEHLGNGGMIMRGNKVVGNTNWFDSIVILGKDGQPKEFPGGIIASKTAYRYPGVPADDPKAYVDSATVPYVCVPPVVIQKTSGVVLGSRWLLTNLENGKQCTAAACDVGPRSKIGEVSIAAAKLLGLDPNPRSGGTSKAIIQYRGYINEPAVINGHTFVLQRSNGTYVRPE